MFAPAVVCPTQVVPTQFDDPPKNIVSSLGAESARGKGARPGGPRPITAATKTNDILGTPNGDFRSRNRPYRRASGRRETVRGPSMYPWQRIGVKVNVRNCQNEKAGGVGAEFPLWINKGIVVYR